MVPPSLLCVLCLFATLSTLVLGFLPVKKYSATFFQRSVLVLAAAWLLLALLAPFALVPSVLAACFAASAGWYFKKENTLKGKLWLSLSSAFGVITAFHILPLFFRSTP